MDGVSEGIFLRFLFFIRFVWQLKKVVRHCERVEGWVVRGSFIRGVRELWWVCGFVGLYM